MLCFSHATNVPCCISMTHKLTGNPLTSGSANVRAVDILHAGGTFWFFSGKNHPNPMRPFSLVQTSGRELRKVVLARTSRLLSSSRLRLTLMNGIRSIVALTSATLRAGFPLKSIPSATWWVPVRQGQSACAAEQEQDNSSVSSVLHRAWDHGTNADSHVQACRDCRWLDSQLWSYQNSSIPVGMLMHF